MAEQSLYGLLSGLVIWALYENLKNDAIYMQYGLYYKFESLIVQFPSDLQALAIIWSQF